MRVFFAFCLLIQGTVVNAQVLPRQFEFDGVISIDQNKVAFINHKEKIISLQLGVIYRIYSFKDSLVYEPSYPWHRKTLMIYHIKDTNRLWKIDTNLPRFNKWIDLKTTKKEGDVLLHQYALPLDSTKYFNGHPTSIIAWVIHNSQAPINWVTQLFQLFKVLDGIPVNSKVVSIEYGKQIYKLGEAKYTNKTIKFTDSGMYTTIDLMERYAKSNRPRN